MLLYLQSHVKREMNSSNETDIIYNSSGEPENPINLNGILIVLKCACSIIGIPLNLLIAITIISLRRLHSKPRNIFLLGITFSNLLIFVPAVIEIIYWILPLESVCQVYMVVVGLPYAILLLNIFLALTDRYAAIKYPKWHRKKVTVRFVIVFLLVTSAFFAFLLKCVYIFGLVSLRCEISVVHSKVLGVITIGFFSSCIIMHFMVYRQTRIFLRGSQPKSSAVKHEISTISARSQVLIIADEDRPQQAEAIGDDQHINFEAIELAPIESSPQNATSSISRKHHPIKIHHVLNNGVLNQMEVDTTRNLVTGVASLFLMACPPILFFLAVHSCRLFSQNHFECSTFNWFAPYFKELWLIHAVYNPLVWLLKNNEFNAIFKTKMDGISGKIWR